MSRVPPRRPRKGNLPLPYRIGVPAFRPIVSLFMKPRLQGTENLPLEGPFILAPNHMANIDPFTMGYCMADMGYHVRFMAKDSLFRVPLLGWVLSKWGMIPVKRESADAANSLIHAETALEQGEVVGFYFEGTLTRDPAFWPMKGKTGLARLALDTRVPIIPVVQWGAQDVMDRYVLAKIRWRRPKLYIRVLPELDYSDIEGSSQNRDGVLELTQRLQSTLMEQSGNLRGQVPPEEPWDSKAHGGPGDKILKPFSKWRRQLAKRTRRQDILAADPS